ncbi:LemA family protein [Caminibacter sp.]
MNPTYITIGVLIFIFIILILMYNSLIYRKNEIEKMEGAINALLKKRHDLIPNLVAAVKKYMNYEKDLLEKITALRSEAIKTQDLTKKMEIENKLSNYLDKLLISVENYPDLKANQNVLQLQATLTDIENELSAARRAYNQAVVDYNNAIEMFPTNIMAYFMHLRKREVFDIPENEKENVNVKELFKN